MQNETEKPDWLKKLEQESWQAELIVSGVAIFGALQLPRLVEKAGVWCLTFFPSDAYMLLYFVSIYLLLSVYILIVGFILHFILRALWIGLVGLNSVFPNGINPEGGYYPRHFMEKVVQEFPHDNSHIDGLDRFCSVIFAFCGFSVLTFVALNVDILLLFGIGKLFKNILPELWYEWFLNGAIVVFILMILALPVLSLKSLQNSPVAKKYQFPYFRMLSKLMFHIFYRPINRLSFTFLTNLQLRQYFAWTFGFFIVLLICSMVNLANSRLIFFARETFLFDLYARTDQTFPENYDNLRADDYGELLSATIEADQISGPSLRVVVPVFKNENEIMENLCGEREVSDSLEDSKKTELRRALELQCLEKYHRFYINDSLYEVTLRRLRNGNFGENSVVTFLPTTRFLEGLNILKIEKIKSESGEVYREMNIPFWFFKK